MKLKKLFENLKRLKPNRKNYKIKWIFKFKIDNDHYMFSFLPTILWEPWIYRYPGAEGIIDIWWLNMHILIGKWTVVKEDENIG